MSGRPQIRAIQRIRFVPRSRLSFSFAMIHPPGGSGLNRIRVSRMTHVRLVQCLKCTPTGSDQLADVGCAGKAQSRASHIVSEFGVQGKCPIWALCLL